MVLAWLAAVFVRYALVQSQHTRCEYDSCIPSHRGWFTLSVLVELVHVAFIAGVGSLILYVYFYVNPVLAALLAVGQYMAFTVRSYRCVLTLWQNNLRQRAGLKPVVFMRHAFDLPPR